MTGLRGSLTLATVVALAACGTPQEQCIRGATRELGTVDRLIAETEATIARGYGYRTDEVVRWAWTVCDTVPIAAPGRATPRPMCWEPYTDTVRRPVAIDPAAEARKLAALKARRTALVRQAEAAVRACRAQYPEEPGVGG
ncbi:MAG: hypothetical protein H6895_00490 [Defluviimonas sp.]|uniref:hypothetical protein n=1 Tax=Albidovulum sp. TaxID=1872424 RepID=UPI001DED90C4|nr:hypothetical protein [Paracoccaceae bacterium]MCC0062562.1 hypothetical protein [Defluviimonas sp.]